MIRNKVIVAIALFTCSLMIMAAIPRVAVAEAAPAPVVLIHEDAEEATYDEWNVIWDRSDLNNASGQDWWCRTTNETHASAHAIYCARNGYNSHYLTSLGAQPWNVNITGIPDGANASSSQYVMRYDTDQDATMRKAVKGASSYANVTMTFWFWSQTGTSDARQPGSDVSVGYDFLNAVYYTGSGTNMVKHVLWTDTYAQATAQTWTPVTVNVPTTATMVGFEFVSGTTAPAGGDASNAFASSGVRVVNGGMLRGVYLDDIFVNGTGVGTNSPLTTNVGDLSSSQNSRSFQVNYTVNDPTAAFSYVNLYYRSGDNGSWTRYVTASNPDGRFTSSPILFMAPGDGRYEFFTQGFDKNGTGEKFHDAPDASTMVSAGVAENGMLLTLGALNSTYAAGDLVPLTWNCTDTNSQIDHYDVMVDGTVLKTVDAHTASYTLRGMSAGGHNVTVRATDANGNTTERSVSLTVESGGTLPQDSGSALSQFVGVIAAIAFIGLLAAGMFVFLRSRKR
jgi:hypothetical protein